MDEAVVIIEDLTAEEMAEYQGDDDGSAPDWRPVFLPRVGAKVIPFPVIC